MAVSCAPFSYVVSATAAISGISPSDGSFHVDITSNPPNPGGHVTLSWTITDNTGGGDLEFYMDIWNGAAWVNRQHLINQNSGSWHQDETFFNTTNTTYQWRVHAKDNTDAVWVNETYSFTTDRKPAKPVNPYPANNSHHIKGDIFFSITVNHPDNDYGAKVYNVTFYEYPSNHIIGYNSTVGGWTNGTTVVCNNAYHARYNGMTYYWYAKTKDDEYWNDNSNVFRFTTYYNDTEQSTVYYSVGAVIYAEGAYLDIEPGTAYYSMGARIAAVQPCETRYPQPQNGSMAQPGHGYLRTYIYKEEEPVDYQVRFYANDTLNETWHQQGSTHTIRLGEYTNNLTIYDAPFSSGTLTEVEAQSTYLRMKRYNEVNYSETFEDGLAQGWTIVNASGPTSGVRTSDGVVLPIGSYYLRVTADDVQTSNASRINLSKYAQANISFYLGGRSLESGEYTKVEVYNGAWHEIKSTQNINPMQQYTVDITSYISADFRIRIFNSGTNDNTDCSYIDSITITGYYYSLNGSRISPIYVLSGIARKSGVVNWTETTSADTNVTVFYDFSSNNGSSWTGWTNLINPGTVAEISDGTRLDWCKLRFRENLSTKNCSETPLLNNLTFNVDRYKEVDEWYETMNFTEAYYWYVTIYNATMMALFTSDMYHFTTRAYTDEEPDIVQCSMGARVYVEGTYSDAEPDIVYYSMGAIIAARTIVMFSNPIPTNGGMDVRVNCPLLSIDITATVPKHMQVTFQQNDDGAWEDIPVMQEMTTDGTVTGFHYQLQYDTTHYWRVKAYNVSTALTQYSSTYHFTTKEYNDTESDIVPYSMGAAIFVEEMYMIAEPNTVYYGAGGEIPVGRTLPPMNPFPANDSMFGEQALANFSCYVEDFDGDNMTVTFYMEETHTPWASVTNVPNSSRVETYVMPSLTNGSNFSWYVTVDDGNWNITGPTWLYMPLNNEPAALVNPDDGANYVSVRRKSIGGIWQMYVKLLANVSDYEHDDVTVQIYIDDPSAPNWNDWVLRFSHVYDSYSVYNSGLYEQDETDFDEIIHVYHWRVYLEDEYGASVDYYMNFTTEFYFWAYYNWTPQHPTDEDTVTLIDLSQNATDIRWMMDGNTIAEANYSSGSHAPFNITYKFNISNVYNISIWVHNDSCNNVDECNAETIGGAGYLYDDRNITINETDGHAGYNYFVYHLNNTVNASQLAQDLDLRQGWWLHKYNSYTRTWESWWLFPAVSNGMGDNFNISIWDVIIITANQNMKKRINMTNPVETSQTLFLPSAYNYVAWSNSSTTTSQNLTIGLQTGDYVYEYDTVLDVWYREWIGFSGDDFDIKSYDVLVIYPEGIRVIDVGD